MLSPDYGSIILVYTNVLGLLLTVFEIKKNKNAKMFGFKMRDEGIENLKHGCGKSVFDN